MKDVGQWLIDKWLAGFVTGVILFTAKIYVDLPPEEKVSFFRFAWFESLITYRIPAWQVLLLCGFFILVIIFQRKKIKVVTEESFLNRVSGIHLEEIGMESFYPDDRVLAYNKDVFGGDRNLWGWNIVEDNTIEGFSISQLKPLCRTCKTKLIIDSSSVGACPLCRLEGKHHLFVFTQVIQDVELAIYSRIENGDWENAQKRVEEYYRDVEA